MKKIAALAVVIASGIGPAIAADMRAPAPVYKAAPVAVGLYDWTGFYIGGRIGGNWSHTDSTTTNTATGLVLGTGSENSSAFHAGGQIGYDFMLANRIVLGVLADAVTGSKGSTTTFNAAGTVGSTAASTTDATGSVRGKLGYGIDNVLIYGTAGWAWTTGTVSRTQIAGVTGLAAPGTIEQVNVNRNGWTAGAGLAYAFWNNWNVFGEYRYSRYNAVNLIYPIAQRATSATTAANAVWAGVNFKF